MARHEGGGGGAACASVVWLLSALCTGQARDVACPKGSVKGGGGAYCLPAATTPGKDTILSLRSGVFDAASLLGLGSASEGLGSEKPRGVQNEHNPFAASYSVVGLLDKTEYLFSDGTYHFELEYTYPGKKRKHVLVWTQTSWLTETTITGYEAVGVPAEMSATEASQFFGGLGLSSSGGTYLDGNGGSPGGWHAVGPTVLSQNDDGVAGFPAHDGRLATAQHLKVVRPKITALSLRGRATFDAAFLLSGRQNEDDATAEAYSIIGKLDRNAYRYKGKYHFELRYAAEDGGKEVLEWRQTSWLTEDTVTGFEAIRLPQRHANFRGLRHPTSGGAYLQGSDGTVVGSIGSGNRGDPRIETLSSGSTSATELSVFSAAVDQAATGTYVTPPSRPFQFTQPPSFCFEENLQSKESVENFKPNMEWYGSVEYCEGVWVCCSRQVPAEACKRASALVRAVFPEKVRGLFAKFRPPKNDDVGPMRLIVMAPGEPASPETGMTGGRTATNFPFVQTSSGDLLAANAWGATTIHELTHGAQGVITQLVDPYFNEELELLFRDARQRSTDGKPNWADRGQGMTSQQVAEYYAAAKKPSYDFGGRYFGGFYIMATSAEYLAEAHSLSAGMGSRLFHEPSHVLQYAQQDGFLSPDGLEKFDPSLLQLLKREFGVPPLPTWHSTLNPVVKHIGANDRAASAWRAVLVAPASRWAWDVRKWSWVGVDGAVFENSGFHPVGTGKNGGFWAGRGDPLLWLGVRTQTPKLAATFVMTQWKDGHSASSVRIDRMLPGQSTWEGVATFELPNDSNPHRLNLDF